MDNVKLASIAPLLKDQRSSMTADFKSLLMTLEVRLKIKTEHGQWINSLETIVELQDQRIQDLGERCAVLLPEAI